jgi:hypothetical protein
MPGSKVKDIAAFGSGCPKNFASGVSAVLCGNTPGRSCSAMGGREKFAGLAVWRLDLLAPGSTLGEPRTQYFHRALTLLLFGCSASATQNWSANVARFSLLALISQPKASLLRLKTTFAEM